MNEDTQRRIWEMDAHIGRMAVTGGELPLFLAKTFVDLLVRIEELERAAAVKVGGS